MSGLKQLTEAEEMDSSSQLDDDDISKSLDIMDSNENCNDQADHRRQYGWS